MTFGVIPFSFYRLLKSVDRFLVLIQGQISGPEIVIGLRVVGF